MFAVKWEGASDLAAALSALPDAVSRSVMLEALKAGAEPMRAQMESLGYRAAMPTHPAEGHFADHVVISTARSVNGVVNDAQQTAVAVGPEKEAFWGTFNELGTANNPARPAARPAFDSEAAGALEIIAEQAWLAITRKLSRMKAPK